MTTTSTPTRLTDDELERMLALVNDSDRVELKLDQGTARPTAI